MKLSDDNDNNINNDLEKGVLLDTKPKTKKPSMYNVLLLNDDYTPMEFVVLVLESVFNKKQEVPHHHRTSSRSRSPRGSFSSLRQRFEIPHRCFLVTVWLTLQSICRHTSMPGPSWASASLCRQRLAPPELAEARRAQHRLVSLGSVGSPSLPPR